MESKSFGCGGKWEFLSVNEAKGPIHVKRESKAECNKTIVKNVKNVNVVKQKKALWETKLSDIQLNDLVEKE